MSLPPKNPYAEELIATARAIAAPGKGILAADESTGTIGKRLAAISLENNETNRRAYRELLFRTEGFGQYCSGVILFDETLRQKAEDGTPLVELIKAAGAIPGIKVDRGTRALPYAPGETYTQGIDDLDKRTAEYYQLGARFAKWRAVLKIQDGRISTHAIQENAWLLARYASICQMNGLVPIVEPEILMDGTHSRDVCEYWTAKVVSACYKALSDQDVLLEGTLLKPNMVLPGKENTEPKTFAENAAATVRALRRSVPAAVPGITFLSGGQTEEEATRNLNAMNAASDEEVGTRPWSLTFSFGRALQQSCILTWKGLPENVAAAQEQLLIRMKANSQAQLGQYQGDAKSAGGDADLYEKGYTY
ncbi:MAG: Fructose-bisphosphate aldolase 6, cytosolic [Cercozoa sp. M6MM]